MSDTGIRISADLIPEWSRPIRIPESIQITHTAPETGITRELSTWQLNFVLSKDVPAGSDIYLELWGGRNNRHGFENPQVSDPKVEGYLTAETADGRSLNMHVTKSAGTFLISTPKERLKKGDKITVIAGDTKGGCPGIRTLKHHAYNKFFLLYIIPVDEKLSPNTNDVWSNGRENRIVAACTMHIIGGPIDHIRAYAPASIRPGIEFTILIRPEDSDCNLSFQKLGKLTLFTNDIEINCKFEKVPHSTCVKAHCSFPKEGIYRVRAVSAGTAHETVSNPIICSNSAQPVYWGMIHGHTEMSDGIGTIEHYFRQLKDEVLLDFSASADHDHLKETSDKLWAETCKTVKRWNKSGDFVAMLGYEWAKWRRNGDGDRNVYYLNDDRPMYRSDDGEYPSPPDLFKVLSKNHEKAIVIPHHPGHSGNQCDWKDHSYEHERLVEIFQMRGSYECTEEEGNLLMEHYPESPPYIPGFIRNGLALGWRSGFTAGGDDHDGHWGTEFRFIDSGNSYKQGLMSVEAPKKTREDIFTAMYQRRVVATTGARLLLTYDLNGFPMGSEQNIRQTPALASSRKISVEFHGMAPVASIDIIRNNKIVHSAAGNGKMDISFTWEDIEPIEKLWMPAAKHCNHPFAFYYVRARQTDNETAWASPIWIDP